MATIARPPAASTSRPKASNVIEIDSSSDEDPLPDLPLFRPSQASSSRAPQPRFLGDEGQSGSTRNPARQVLGRPLAIPERRLEVSRSIARPAMQGVLDDSSATEHSSEDEGAGTSRQAAAARAVPSPRIASTSNCNQGAGPNASSRNQQTRRDRLDSSTVSSSSEEEIPTVATAPSNSAIAGGLVSVGSSRAARTQTGASTSSTAHNHSGRRHLPSLSARKSIPSGGERSGLRRGSDRPSSSRSGALAKRARSSLSRRPGAFIDDEDSGDNSDAASDASKDRKTVGRSSRASASRKRPSVSSTSGAMPSPGRPSGTTRPRASRGSSVASSASTRMTRSRVAHNAAPSPRLHTVADLDTDSEDSDARRKDRKGKGRTLPSVEVSVKKRQKRLQRAESDSSLPAFPAFSTAAEKRLKDDALLDFSLDYTDSSVLLPSLSDLNAKSLTKDGAGPSIITKIVTKTILQPTDLADDLECAICSDIMVSPVNVSCGHTFCESCVVPWLDQHHECPECRTRTEVPPVRSYLADRVIKKHLEATWAALESQDKHAEAKAARQERVRTEDDATQRRITAAAQRLARERAAAGGPAAAGGHAPGLAAHRQAGAARAFRVPPPAMQQGPRGARAPAAGNGRQRRGGPANAAAAPPPAPAAGAGAAAAAQQRQNNLANNLAQFGQLFQPGVVGGHLHWNPNELARRADEVGMPMQDLIALITGN